MEFLHTLWLVSIEQCSTMVGWAWNSSILSELHFNKNNKTCHQTGCSSNSRLSIKQKNTNTKYDWKVVEWLQDLKNFEVKLLHKILMSMALTPRSWGRDSAD